MGILTNMKDTHKSLLTVASIVSLLSCSETPWQATERERKSEVKSETRYGDGWIYTVEHDKHLFILEGRYSKGAMIHHPDCPCGKAN